MRRRINLKRIDGVLAHGQTPHVHTLQFNLSQLTLAVFDEDQT